MSLAIPEPEPVQGVALCPATASACRCRETAGHEPPHACPCGGKWTGDFDTDDFECVALPSMTPLPGLGFSEEW